MAYISVEDPTQPATSPIIGVYNMPQNDSVLGYIGEVDDSDPRIVIFQQAMISASQS